MGVQQIIKPQKIVLAEGLINNRVAPGVPLLAMIMSLSLSIYLSAWVLGNVISSQSVSSIIACVAVIFLTFTIRYDLFNAI